MNKNYPYKQAVITGLIVGVFAISCFTLFDNLNRQQGWGINAATIRGLTGLLTLVILGIGIYSGMQKIKRSNGGQLSYGQAVLAGFLVSLTTGVIVALIDIIYCNYFSPGYAAHMIGESSKAMMAAGKTPAEIAANMPALRQEWSTGGQMMQALVGQTVMGTVIALVMALFIKTKK